MSGTRKLSEVLDDKAEELVGVWAYRNKDKIWLGGPSRQKVKDELIEALRWAYGMAKKKYTE